MFIKPQNVIKNCWHTYFYVILNIRFLLLIKVFEIITSLVYILISIYVLTILLIPLIYPNLYNVCIQMDFHFIIYKIY